LLCFCPIQIIPLPGNTTTQTSIYPLIHRHQPRPLLNQDRATVHNENTMSRHVATIARQQQTTFRSIDLPAARNLSPLHRGINISRPLSSYAFLSSRAIWNTTSKAQNVSIVNQSTNNLTLVSLHHSPNLTVHRRLLFDRVRLSHLHKEDGRATRQRRLRKSRRMMDKRPSQYQRHKIH
jgi:hypothetical protein